MRKLNKLIRNENGSITMFVTLSVLFLIFVLVGIYANYANKLKAQEEQIGKIQNNYGQHASDEGMDKLYIKQTQTEENTEGDGEGDTGEENIPLLPSEYQQVEYIESTGTQYIDTGINGGEKMAFYIKLNTLGARATDYEQYFAGDITPNGIKIYAEEYVLLQGASTNIDTYPIDDSNIHTIEFTDEGTAKVDDVIVQESIPNNGWGTLTYYIFSSHSEPTLMSSMRLYELKMWKDGKLVRDYIPCYKKSEKLAGLYDLVEKEFFPNEGTGIFTYEE